MNKIEELQIKIEELEECKIYQDDQMLKYKYELDQLEKEIAETKRALDITEQSYSRIVQREMNNSSDPYSDVLGHGKIY